MVAAIVVFSVLASLTVIERHRDYRTYRNDLGNMVQVVDNTAHGRILQMTGNDGRQIDRLESHVDPILALFALPWLVWPDPALLLIIQAVLVALAAWPVYRLGRRVLGDAPAGGPLRRSRRSSTLRCSSPRSTSSTRSRWPSPCCCSRSSSSRRTVAGSRCRSSCSRRCARRRSRW